MAKKILYIEDEPNLRKIIGEVLEEEGFKMIFASDGEVGLCLAKEERPDLILLDLKMPGVDGFEVCRSIRSSSQLKHTKILAMTAFGDEHREKILKMGADGFLEKPFKWDELKEKIVDHLAALKGNKSI